MPHVAIAAGTVVFLFACCVERPLAQTMDGSASFSERFHFGPELRPPSIQRKRPSFLRSLGIKPAGADEAPSAPAEAAPPPAPTTTAEESNRAITAEQSNPAPAPKTSRKSPPRMRQENKSTKVTAAGGKRIARGRAAYYEHPGKTASGEVYKPNGLTAAHKTLPFGTRVRVVNLENGKAVIVRINDRMPKSVRFVIDLSRGSARALGITKAKGVAQVALFASSPRAASQHRQIADQSARSR